ncbi:hypothetical protein QM007_06770 [Rothia sp. SD9660Na]|uniref:hypothetical protein n=1 Tax=Rothia sp. SD9660Na TaxID=3047030 RepID=UPI0024BB03B3|nr:hypothetical protein [Rothia sp. SD9660Na]WHS49631.1 hypothetical protein QM007_06770 [Rothia sp. SD9660Na]
MNYNRYFTIIISFISLASFFCIIYLLIKNPDYLDIHPEVLPILAALTSSVGSVVALFLSKRTLKEATRLNGFEKIIQHEHMNKNLPEIRFMEKYNRMSNLISDKYNLKDCTEGYHKDPIIYQLNKYQQEHNIEMRDSLRSVMATRNMIVHDKTHYFNKSHILIMMENIDKILDNIERNG